MIDVCDGMASGFWMRISAGGLFVLRGVNDAQMSVEEIRVSPRQFAAMRRKNLWMAGAEWLEVPTQYPRDPETYWAKVMQEWSMDTTATYETFDGDLPVRVARRLGVLRDGNYQYAQ